MKTIASHSQTFNRKCEVSCCFLSFYFSNWYVCCWLILLFLSFTLSTFLSLNSSTVKVTNIFSVTTYQKKKREQTTVRSKRRIPEACKKWWRRMKVHGWIKQAVEFSGQKVCGNGFPHRERYFRFKVLDGAWSEKSPEIPLAPTALHGGISLVGEEEKLRPHHKTLRGQGCFGGFKLLVTLFCLRA